MIIKYLSFTSDRQFRNKYIDLCEKFRLHSQNILFKIFFLSSLTDRISGLSKTTRTKLV